MTGYDYNILNTCFYIAYIIFELPAMWCCKRYGPGKWLPFISVGFGVLSLATAFCHNFGSACAVRFILGIFEAGMLPGISVSITCHCLALSCSVSTSAILTQGVILLFLIHNQYYLSRWYRKSELVFRLSLYFVSSSRKFKKIHRFAN
jgi:MFS family permease